MRLQGLRDDLAWMEQWALPEGERVVNLLRRVADLFELPEGAQPWAFEDGVGAEMVVRDDLFHYLFGEEG